MTTPTTNATGLSSSKDSAGNPRMSSLDKDNNESDGAATGGRPKDCASPFAPGKAKFRPNVVLDGLDKSVSRKLLRATSSKLSHFSTNSKKFPTAFTVKSEHERIQERLESYGLVEKMMNKDGNCQFCALSDQLYRSPSHHKLVRQQVSQHLKRNSEDFKEFVPEDFDKYCTEMSKKGTWGDHVTLKAAADCFGVNIWLLTSYPQSAVLEINGKQQNTDHTIYLSFWAEVHYNSLYPEGQLNSESHANALVAFLNRQIEGISRLGRLMCFRS